MYRHRGWDFTHKGWLYGCVPVFIDMRSDPEPVIQARHELLEPWMWLMDQAFKVFCLLRSVVDPTFEPYFPIRLDERL